MKYFIAVAILGLLAFAAAEDAFAQKGAGYGYGQGAYGRGPHAYGQRGPLRYGLGHGGHWGHWNHHRYHGPFHHVHNVPVLPPPAYAAGPPTPTVTYPYYTTRGPRDFLLDNPPGIGP